MEGSHPFFLEDLHPCSFMYSCLDFSLWLSTCYSHLLTIYCKTKRHFIVFFSGLITRDENLRSFISREREKKSLKIVDCQPRLSVVMDQGVAYGCTYQQLVNP